MRLSQLYVLPFPLSGRSEVAFETLPAVCCCRRHGVVRSGVEVKRVPTGAGRRHTSAALTTLTVYLSSSHLSRPLVQNKDVSPSLSLVLKEVEF